MLHNVLNCPSKMIKSNFTKKTVRACNKIEFSSFINYPNDEDIVTLSNNEIHQDKDGLWHLTKHKDKNRIKFRKNIDYINKKYSKFKTKFETCFEKTKNIFETEIKSFNESKYNKFLFYITSNMNSKINYYCCLSELYQSINKLLNINSNFSKSSYMPSTSEQFIGDEILRIKNSLNKLQNNKYLTKRKSELKNILNELSLIVDDLNLKEFNEKIKFNKEYKLNKINKKIALAHLNKENPNYIKLKYKNKNLTDNMYYYNKEGNMRVAYESAEDEINQLEQNRYRIEMNDYPRISIRPNSSKEKYQKINGNSKYNTSIIKDSRQINKIFVSPDNLRILFPTCFPTQTVGDCYLVNVFNQMLLNDKDRMRLYNCFQEINKKDGKYIKVKFPNLKYHLSYKSDLNDTTKESKIKSFLNSKGGILKELSVYLFPNYDSLIKYNYGSLNGSPGFIMLEEVYCVNRILDRLEATEKSDLIPNDIKQLVKKYKSSIKKNLFDTTISLDDRIEKLSKNKEISTVLEYTFKKINEMKYQYIEQLHDKNFISDNDYNQFKEGVEPYKFVDIILFLTPFLEKNDSELPKFNNKTEKENYYKNYISSIRFGDDVPFNDTFNKLLNLSINGFKTIEAGYEGEVAKAFGYKIKTKFVNRLTQKEYPEIMLNDMSYNFDNVQPEGGLMSHHAQSIIGIQKYGLRVQEPNSSNRDQIVLFDYYPKLFNSERKEFMVIEHYS